MKRFVCVFISVFFCLTIFQIVVSAENTAVTDIIAGIRRNMVLEVSEEDAIPVNEALQLIDTADKILLSDDFSAYDPNNSQDYEISDIRMLVLQREAPRKEFTEYDTGYPDHYVPGLPDDFVGIDIGMPKVWLRCDIMRELPDFMRPTTLEEADLILMVENEYVWSGTITNSITEGGTDEEPPVFDTTEELLEYMETHKPVVKSIQCYPKFGNYQYLNLYDTATKYVALYDYKYTSPERFAKNPQAADLQYDLEEISDLLDMLLDGSSDKGEINRTIDDINSVPDEKKQLWKMSVDSGEIDTAAYSVNSYYWEMATGFLELDDSELNRANYEQIIESKDRFALEEFIDYADYSGFDIDVELIGSMDRYFAKTDEEWYDSALESFMSELT